MSHSLRSGWVQSLLRCLSESWLFFLLWICRCYCPSLGVLTRGWSWLPLPCLTSPVWSSCRFWLLGAGSRPVSPLCSLAPSHSGVCAVRVTVPPCFLAYCGAPWLMALRSSHCRITAGLASMDRPLLVSSAESQLCECLFVVLPRQLVGSGVYSPASPICPTSSVLKRSSLGSLLRFSRQVFAMGSPLRVESVSVLDRNEVSSSTFLVFGWSLRDGVTLSGRFCLRSRSERRLFARLPLWLEPSLRDGVTRFGSCSAFLRSRSE